MGVDVGGGGELVVLTGEIDMEVEVVQVGERREEGDIYEVGRRWVKGELRDGWSWWRSMVKVGCKDKMEGRC